MRLVALILLLFPVMAWGNASEALTIVGYVLMAIPGWQLVGYALVVGTAVYGASEARRKASEAADNAKVAFNNSLKDRTITRVGTDAAPRIIYGESIVGSDIVAMFKSGAIDEYKHLVCVHAGHECQSIDEIYINDIPVGALDAGGWATGGAFGGLSRTESAREVYYNATATLAHTPIVGTMRVVSKDIVYKMVNGRSIAIKNYAFTFTHIGSALTITDPLYINDSWHDYYVTYQYTLVTSRIKVRKHLGTPTDPVDADLNTLFPTDWPTTSVLRDYTYTVITLDLHQPEFQGGIPSIKAKIKGKKLYDLRTKTSAYSTNPALAIYDYLTSDICGVEPVAVSNSGTAQAATPASLTLAATANATDDFYTGMGVRITSGAGAGQERNVLTSRKNLVKYSQAVDNAAYNGAYVVTPNAAIAPDGTLTADKVFRTAAPDYRLQLCPIVGTSGGRTFTYSLWLWTDAGQSTSATLYIYPSLTDIHAVAVVLTTTPTRYTFTATIAPTETNAWLNVRADVGVGNYMYEWGWQLEEGSVATEYIHTEANAAVGASIDVPWSSNYYTYSEQLDHANWTGKSAWMTTTPNADGIAELVSVGTWPGASAQTLQALQAFTPTSGLVVQCIEVKKNVGDWVELCCYDAASGAVYQARVNFNLTTRATFQRTNTGTVITGYGIVDVGNGYLRIWMAVKLPTLVSMAFRSIQFCDAAGSPFGDTTGMSHYVRKAQVAQGWQTPPPYLTTTSAVIALPDATSVYDVYAEGDIPWSDVIAAANACDPITGCTYSQVGNTVTVTKANHGLNTGDVREFQPLTGTAISEHQPVIVTAYNTFTYTSSNTATTSGNLTIAGLYTINGTVQADQDPRKVLPLLAQSMCGGIVGTTWNMWAGVYQAPLMALDQSDIVGPMSFVSGANTADLYNGVKGQFISSENGYVATDYAPYQNTAYVTADGGVEKWYNLDLPYTNQQVRARNIARISAEEQRNGFTLKAVFSLKTWSLKIGDRVSFTSSLFGQTGKIYRISDKRFGVDQAVELTLKEDAPSIWDTIDAPTVDSTLNTNLPNPWLIDPVVINAEPQSGTNHLQVLSDGSIVSRIFITWPLDITVSKSGVIEIEWQNHLTDAWQRMTVSGDATQAYISPVEDSAWYTIRIRAVNPTLNVKSDWAYFTYTDAVSGIVSTSYQVIGKTQPPPNMTDLFLHGTELSWSELDKVATPDLAGYVFRFQYGSNTDWGTAAPLHNGIISASPYTLASQPSGAVTVMGKVVDTTGNESVATIDVFTLLGDAPIANIVETRNFDPTYSGALVNCTVVAGDVVATALDSFYGADIGPFYNGGDAASFYEPTSYPAMSYTTDQFRISSALAGSIATLQFTTAGDNVVVEYRAVNPVAFFSVPSDTFFGPDADLFFGDESTWQPWPAQIVINNDIYQFRISIGASTTQGKIMTMALVIDAPDIVETLNNVSVPATTGTTLAYTKPFTSIQSVQATLQSGAAMRSIEIDKTSPLAPKIFAYDSTHTAVAAVADVTIKGY